MEISREDMDRMLFFEDARQQAEADYKKDNTNMQALTRWGGALLEMAHFYQGQESVDKINEAITKFKTVIKKDPKKHDAQWCLGNAYTSLAFMITETQPAHDLFDKASDCFKKALKEEPSSEMYAKALEMTEKAPALHAELQKQLASSQFPDIGRPSAGATRQSSKVADWWYDVAGWVILVGLGIGIVALVKRSPTPAPLSG